MWNWDHDERNSLVKGVAKENFQNYRLETKYIGIISSIQGFCDMHHNLKRRVLTLTTNPMRKEDVRLYIGGADKRSPLLRFTTLDGPAV